jgi:glycosyltransferase involved in cell wall biosynthesis
MQAITPIISIIMPTYNSTQFLDSAIMSCVNQTVTDWELIIVDDGSSEENWAIIKSYVDLDPRIQCIRHEANRKLPAALNTGVRHARGQYITWTSDDNCYHPHALAQMLAFLERHPEYVVVYTDYSEIDETGRIMRQVVVQDYEKVLVFKSCIGPCFLYRHTVHDEIGLYDESLFLAEDYDFWLRTAAQFKLYPLHLRLYDYRRHPASLTERELKANRWRVREQAILKSLPRLVWLTTQTRARAYLHLAELAARRGAFWTALHYIGVAFRYRPILVIYLSIRNPVVRLLGDDITLHLHQGLSLLKRRITGENAKSQKSE